MKKNVTRVIGLNSGTSMDGVDAALVEIRGAGPGLSARVVDFRHEAIRKGDRERLLRAAGRGAREAEERARLHARVGELFARAALRLAERNGGIGTIDLIGSHGQTLLHLPARREGASVQIGDGAVIAARTGTATVFDFRAADVAAGGEGAPLLPLTDWLLFRSPRRDRVLLNIGGIANFTLLPAGCSLEEVVAFDTGPGNALIDRIARLASGGKRRFDPGGAGAARGIVDRETLARLMRHPFLRRRPPKSTGTSVFGDAMAGELWEAGRKKGLGAEGILATATAFTARSAAEAIAARAAPDAEVYVCGGGARNRTLAAMIADGIAPRPLLPFEKLGVDPDAREAVGFALLAGEFVAGNRYDLGGITGSRGAPLLGVLAPGSRPFRIVWRKEKDA
ncbi:MAG: anhydro-N-acetylmuramic acid kinase [Candidatus Eisenbacteria bacterium]|nr:anhydro-N-acetylmuramic acid kinase [Candidatus Eisenbacteria bacterium]